MLLGPILMTPTPPCSSLDNVNSVFVPQQLTSLPSLHMPPAKRPKLSLQTTHLSTNYGISSSNTGARTETMSTTTPTTLNTLSNTFDLTIRPSPISSTSSPAPFQLSKSACSSPYARRRPHDLNLPFGRRPILKNSSLHQQYRRSTLTTSASPRHGRRSFFPAPKKVSFQVVEEEIVTQTYVARHVDLNESSDEEYQSADETTETAIVPFDDVLTLTQANGPNVTQSPEIGRAGMKRGRSVGGRSASAMRSKRKRRWWEWTLADLERAEAETMATVKAEEVIADAEAEVQLQMETEEVVADAEAEVQLQMETEEVVADAEAEVQLQMETETEEAKAEDGVVEAVSADSKTVDVVPQSIEEEKEPGCYEALDGLGHDSDWDTITSSTLSTPQMEQTKLEEWDDLTISDDT